MHNPVLDNLLWHHDLMLDLLDGVTPVAPEFVLGLWAFTFINVRKWTSDGDVDNPPTDEVCLPSISVGLFWRRAARATDENLFLRLFLVDSEIKRGKVHNFMFHLRHHPQDGPFFFPEVDGYRSRRCWVVPVVVWARFLAINLRTINVAAIWIVARALALRATILCLVMDVFDFFRPHADLWFEGVDLLQIEHWPLVNCSWGLPLHFDFPRTL